MNRSSVGNQREQASRFGEQQVQELRRMSCGLAYLEHKAGARQWWARRLSREAGLASRRTSGWPLVPFFPANWDSQGLHMLPLPVHLPFVPITVRPSGCSSQESTTRVRHQPNHPEWSLVPYLSVCTSVSTSVKCKVCIPGKGGASVRPSLQVVKPSVCVS